jgi:hypothetical protein
MYGTTKIHVWRAQMYSGRAGGPRIAGLPESPFRHSVGCYGRQYSRVLRNAGISSREITEPVPFQYEVD